MVYGSVGLVHGPVAHDTQPSTTGSMAQYNMVHGIVEHVNNTAEHGAEHSLVPHGKWPGKK